MFIKKESNKWYFVKSVLSTELKGKHVYIFKTNEGDLVIDGRLKTELDRQLLTGQKLSCIGRNVKFFLIPWVDKNGFSKTYWEMKIENEISGD